MYLVCVSGLSNINLSCFTLIYLVVLCVFPPGAGGTTNFPPFADTHSHAQSRAPPGLSPALSRHQHRPFPVCAHWAGPTLFPTERFTPILTAGLSEPHQYPGPWLTTLSNLRPKGRFNLPSIFFSNHCFKMWMWVMYSLSLLQTSLLSGAYLNSSLQFPHSLKLPRASRNLSLQFQKGNSKPTLRHMPSGSLDLSPPTTVSVVRVTP